LTLDDKSGRIELSVWAEKYNAYREILSKDALLVVKGAISEDSFTGGLKMVADSIQSIYEARCSKLRCLELTIPADSIDWAEKVHSTLGGYRDGNCKIIVDYHQDHARGTLYLGNDWKIQPQDELIARLREQFGQNSVIMRYD
jgi:DNA polymerase-3 subunit alpha